MADVYDPNTLYVPSGSVHSASGGGMVDTTTFIHDKVVTRHHTTDDDDYDDMADGRYQYRTRAQGWDSTSVKNYSISICFMATATLMVVLMVFCMANYAEISATVSHIHVLTGRGNLMTARMNMTHFGISTSSVMANVATMLTNMEDQPEITLANPFYQHPKKKKGAQRHRRRRRDEDDEDEADEPDEEEDDDVDRRPPVTPFPPAPSPSPAPTPPAPV